MAIKKRFIAGATCPACNAVDRLVVIMEEGRPERRECVACGFSDTQETLTPSEIPTRVIPKQEADAELQPLRFVPSTKPDEDKG
ncbi:YheV family putative zinc ribbon protein [Aestuariirhabdus litorea]|uniref:YheV family putative metal-binding protein n=1 Tax=Aestuariirhabdus litorea TaxID=2528527 RepID=A0A3P3VIS5_9GAMM|nr:YheV family putative zinc ribbon protein [Aestuariirhabdus litorea]RRJ82572.1 YheV family putative metal-binding protein [Aestuariirhabdus litorea]RWW92731.1 YheV family putative metal-binding protein [Endozoicomonadaceae bacterium GTF-13]